MSNNLINLFCLFAISLALSMLFTPWMIRLAYRFGVLDFPAKRKVHTKPMPRLGGVGMYLAFFITLFLGYEWSFNGLTNLELGSQIYGLFIGATVIALFGLWDDINELNPFVKVFGQILAGVILFTFGYGIEFITNPFGGTIQLPHTLSIFITVGWIAALTNAINLIDGIDGLAAGLVTIIGGILCLTGLFLHTDTSIFLLAPLVGAALGFLRYNFPPARIFMGDSGSCFLGFILAAASLVGSPHKIATTVALLVPITALWIPIYDTILAIIRRAIGKTHNIFIADKNHLHHRLLTMGLTQRQVVLLMYVICVYFCIISFLFILIPPEYAFVLLFLLSIGVFLGVRTLGFIERRFRAVYAKGFRSGRRLKNQ